MVDGKQVVKNGLSLTLDEERIRREAQRAFERLSTIGNFAGWEVERFEKENQMDIA
ncbi:S-adenosylhomocysteine deaminase [Paenibacillus sp. JCM 10914]|nr:S-adenosylhomocysteine deaminase [Paenibacillus sp. JCM 10914]